jgi:hypothetical protein
MNEENKNKRYPLEKIKEIFRSVLTDNRMTDEEFSIFCEGIKMLPLEITEQVKKEVYFVILSSNKKDGGPACWLNLRDLKDKKGVIFFAPCFFDLEARQYFIKNKNLTEEKSYFLLKQKKEILHEVAHYCLRHNGCTDPETYERYQREADDLAYKWLSLSD